LPVAQRLLSSQEVSVPILPDTTIPIMAQAVLLSMDNDTTTAIQASVASTPPEALVLGGMATYYYSEYVESSSSMPSSPAPPPLARRPPAPATTPTIAALLEEMTCSINDFDILSQRLQDDRWSFLLSRICAYEFVSMLAHVNMDADQPRVAELLARYYSSSCRFTCEYAREAAKNATDWNCSTTVQRLLPYCVDIEINYNRIREVLSEWDQTILRSDFEQAVARKSRRGRS
jgi:hypothetical protein